MESKYSPRRMRRPAISLAVSGLAVSLLASCGGHETTPPKSANATSKCDPMSVDLIRSTQEAIIDSRAWPTDLRALPHTGNIISIILQSGNGLVPGSTDPSLQDAHEIVDAFDKQFPAKGASVIVLSPDHAIKAGTIRLTEYDENCKSLISLSPNPVAST